MNGFTNDQKIISKYFRLYKKVNLNLKSLLFLVNLIYSINLCAQQDNYSFLKLAVLNEEQNIMLVKWNGAWEIPGIRYNQPVSILKFLDTLAAEHGITIANKKLNGLFTFEYEHRSVLTVMHYFTATYKDGNLKVPSNCEDIGWFDLKAAFGMIPFKEMVDILQLMSSQPDRLWGGAIKKSESGEVDYTEDFYKLN